MNRLKNTCCYLAGAMDRVADGGVGWRQRIKLELTDLGIQWFDPTSKPIDLGVEDEEARRQIHAAKLQGDYVRVAEIIKPIRLVDLRMIDLSHFLIVFLDRDNNGFGTIEEITLANREKKPVLICQEGGKQFAPNWLFGMIPHEHIFGCWEELISYVRHIATDKVIDNMGRWYFFDFHGEQPDTSTVA